MVTPLKIDDGIQIVSATVQKTIQSIKEIVGNHSDTEIYNTLQESNMDPNETAQKLLNQDHFHVVRRRRDKKKENAGYNAHVEPRKHTEYGQGVKYNGSDHNARRGSYRRSPAYDSGVSREFRVVRDNRVNQNSDREAKALTQVPSPTNVHRTNNVLERSSFVVPYNQRHWGGRYSQYLNGVRDFRPKMARDINSDPRNGHYEKKFAFTSSETQVTTVNSNNSNSLAGSAVSFNDVGVYASASDPVHNPSDSGSSAAIGAKRRDLGVVGSRRQSSDSSSKQSIQQSNSNVNSVVGASTTESFRQISSPRNDQTHSTVVDFVMVSSTGSRSSSHFGTRSHPQSVAHQKGALPGKEWKPKTNQKSSAPSPGVIGSPVKPFSPLADNSKNPETGTEQLQEKLSQVNIQESQNVIIAQHIRVPENDRCRLTFGTFGLDSDDTQNCVSAFQAADSIEEPIEPSPSNQQLNSADDQVRNSGSSSPSGASSENSSPDNKDSRGAPNPVDFNEMGLVHDTSSLTASKSQQHQESTELPNFSAYDQQPVYEMSYFRPSIDDAVRGSGLPSPPITQALSSHAANNVLASSVGMLQQQTPMAQMYPQVHVSHFANVMPYRQYLPPFYVPPMVPGFSGNPGYPHLSNGSSYVLMPGGGSHLPANSLKYGVQQFKAFPSGSPTGFGNLANPSGYAINAPGVVGGPTGLDDSSRLKYKDNNLYVPNPQAETSEVWIQNHRELPGMQSNPYYNMQGQTAHPAYLQSHTGHASFNGAGVAQSSQMQFPGMYPPQPAAIPNAHHLGGGNIGVGVAPPTPGAQVGAYQQPQMSHLNWTTNF